jgi:hypothetical protein
MQSNLPLSGIEEHPVILLPVMLSTGARLSTNPTITQKYASLIASKGQASLQSLQPWHMSACMIIGDS